MVVHDHNRGKGAAVRTGMLRRTPAGRSRSPTPTSRTRRRQLCALLAEVESGWDVVVGSRRPRRHARRSCARRSCERRRPSHQLAHAFGAARPLPRHAVRHQGVPLRRGEFIFDRTRIDGFAFDVELFAIVERNGLSLTEVPVTVSHTSRSTVHVGRETDGRLVRDLLRIRKWARAGVYDASTGDDGEVASPRMGAYDAVFKAYDIRGTVPDELDAAMCRAIGAAFARFAGAGRVLVARDMRPSGVELSGAFADGVRSQGVDVVDLGMASTDLIYYAAGTLDAPGAMFTASHNPAQYNGIKLCLAGAKPDRRRHRPRSRSRRWPSAGVEPAGTRGKLDAGRPARRLRRPRALVRRRRRAHAAEVIADTANGMGGLVVPIVFEPLPFELEIMYGELDGTFPNHPADPIQPENLRDLVARVRERRAPMSASRSTATPTGSSSSTTRVCRCRDRRRPPSWRRRCSTRQPGATILYNCICSKAVAEVIRENGGTPVRTRVGHSFIKAVMAETGAAFGGEHSAHYYFRDNYRADSGSIAALVVLEQLCLAGVPLSELRKPFERYAQSGEINLEFADPAAVIERVAEEYKEADQDRLDGLTVDLGDWWFNLRPSNTEPLLRLNLEAATARRGRRGTWRRSKAAMGE